MYQVHIIMYIIIESKLGRPLQYNIVLPVRALPNYCDEQLLQGKGHG